MTTPNTAQEPTPWTDEREGRRYPGHENSSFFVESDLCRTLERHLRRIVEAHDAEENGTDFWGVMKAISERRAAIQAAKEELNK